MKDGFIRVAAATPDLKVADPVFNREQTWKMMQEVFYFLLLPFHLPNLHKLIFILLHSSTAGTCSTIF